MSQTIRELYFSALYDKSDATKRLSTPKSIDDYFEKQEATKKAIDHLERGDSVPEEIAKVVDVEALKNSINSSNEAEDATNALASQIGGSNNKLDEFVPKNIGEKMAIEDYEECCKKLLLSVKKEEALESSLSPQDRVKKEIEDMLGKVLVNSKAIDLGEEVKELFNPLERKDEEIKESENIVSIFDEHSGKNVDIALNENSIKRLVEKFGSLEEAGDYVKGWYFDAAYRVGYLKADGDSDGKISFDEAKDLKALIGIQKSEEPTYMSLNQAISDREKRDDFLDKFGYIDNMSDFINNSILQDRDIDGGLNLSEIVGEERSADVASAIVSEKRMDIFEFNSLAYGFENDLFSFISRFANMLEMDNLLSRDSKDSEKETKQEIKQEEKEVVV